MVSKAICYKLCYKSHHKAADTSPMKYVQNVRGSWTVRITVPPELRGIIGKRELSENGLPDDAKARERAAIRIINRFLTTLGEAEAQLRAESNDPTLHLSRAAKTHYSSILNADEKRRASMPTEDDIAIALDQAAKQFSSEHDAGTLVATSIFNVYTDHTLKVRARYDDQRIRTGRLAALRENFNNPAITWFAPVVDAHIAANNLKIDAGSPAWRELAQALMRAEIEALERTLERDQANFSGRPEDPLLTAPDPTPQPLQNGTRSAGPKLSEALAGFHAERSAGGGTLAAKTMEEHRNAVRMFNEFVGADLGVTAITKKQVIDYKNALLQTPNRYTMRFPGLTLPQAIRANQKLAEPFTTLAPQTINEKWLSHLRTVLSWAERNDHLQINPALGIRVETGSKSHKEPSRSAFDPEDIAKIFGHEMFRDPGQYGTKQWALLVMLYTGVRNSSEMARIRLSKISEVQGIPIFNLDEASKNQQSKRLVPMHQDLIKLGFLDFVAARRLRGEEYLFPEWAKRTDSVNDWFNVTYLPSLGIKTAKKVFYCFRHTLATELAKAGVPRELSKMISGHEPQEIASVYIQASPITLMAKELNKVKFDLPMLSAHA